MDGTLSLKFKDGTEKIIANVTAFDKVGDKYKITYEGEFGYPMELIDVDNVDYFMMW